MNRTRRNHGISLSALLLALSLSGTCFVGQAQMPNDKRLQAMQLYNEALRHKAQPEKTAKLKALENFQRAQAIFQQLGDYSSAGAVLIEIGRTYGDLYLKAEEIGSYTQALSFYELEQKQSGMSERNQSGRATALNGIGWAYRALGEKNKALENYFLALKIYRSLKQLDGESITLRSIGAAYLDLGRNSEALEYLQQALKIEYDINDEFARATTLDDIATAHKNLGKHAEALKYYGDALRIFRRWGVPGAATIYRISMVYADLGNNEASLKHLSDALVAARSTTDRETEVKILTALMWFWIKQNNPRFAIFYGKRAINLSQAVRENIKKLGKDLQRAYLKSVEDVYRALADLLIKRGRVAEAEQVLGMLKEAEYFEYLRRDDKVAKELLSKLSLTPAEQDAFKRYEELADRLTALGKEYGALQKESLNYEAGRFPKQLRLDELDKQLSDANKVFNAFLEELKVKFGENDARVAVVDSGTQALLKELNQPRTVIISTIVGEDQLNLIVTTADASRAHTVNIKAADLNTLVGKFREAVKKPAIDPRSLGKKLYDILFPPALEKDLENVKASMIVWSLDGTLRYVPLAALWDGKQYLLERYANVVITLANRDNLKLAPTDRATWQALGVGVSKKFQDFDALTAVPEELCGIINDPQSQARCNALAQEARAGALTGRSLLNEEFTLQAFKNNLGRYPIVHVATHFSLNPGNETSSYLLLGSGDTDAERKLTLDTVRNEFKTKFVGVELLTLSACNTAMTAGDKSNGVEIEGFGTLAQKQGAKAVIATLWAVADPSTRDLMKKLYLLLEADNQTSKAEALRQAQLALLNGNYKPEEAARKRASEFAELSGSTSLHVFQRDPNAPFEHPYYWSPFVLFGNWK